MRKKRIGVLGCARILDRALFTPLKSLEPLSVHAIASRTKPKAESYAEKYGIPRAFGGYEELLACGEIDFVYIALSNELHAEWAIRALQAGKPVLVEKPICLNTEELRRLMDAQAASGLPVLEGLMVQHHPWQSEIKRMVDRNAYGGLLEVRSQISVPFRDPERQSYRSFPERGGGAFYDFGCYWLQFLQAVLGLEPAGCDAESDFAGPGGCDWTFRASLDYAGGVRAGLVASFELPMISRHTLEFEHAVVTVDDFFRASLGTYRMTMRVRDKQSGAVEKLAFEPQNYFVNQLAFFSGVLDGTKSNVPLAQSYERMAVHERLLTLARAKLPGYPPASGEPLT
ncbi:Gfo/Idh/MocA family protein [Paenibacillus ehimensis]|uniref:Gfo/Idh/MocA family protein n=1 Tax=Paenibacillus ehimensis TaxID=79264 RepID=UPI000FD8819E|nr:Gfo/Idh/MocA family oxidoreductase [Paenibacillus ehimensis]